MSSTARVNMLIGAGFVLFLLGAKLVLIDRFGSNLPFWDQWDAEGLRLYVPYLEGTLGLDQLLAAHNEHRILITRLFNLFLLEVNGLWFPKLQMVANAGLHVAILTGLVLVVGRELRPAPKLFLALFVALAFSLPFGWENTLAGFQSQFYFAFGFSFIGVVLMVPERAFSLRWCLGLVSLLAASLSMSSGVLAVAAIVAASALQMILGVRARNVVEAVGVLLLCLAFGAIYRTVPVIEGHDALRAASVIEFVWSFFKVAAWPVPLNLPAALLLNLPIATLFVLTVRKREPMDGNAWLLIGTMAWVGLQWISFAYGRAETATSSRYTDTLMVGVVVNVGAALHLMPLLRGRKGWAVLYCALVLVVVGAAGTLTVGQAIARKTAYEIQTANMRAFFATGDIEALRALPPFALPYPDADRLAMIATDPALESILHPDVTGEAATAELLLPDALTDVARSGQLALLRAGVLIAALGAAAFLGVAFCVLRVRHPLAGGAGRTGGAETVPDKHPPSP